MYRRTLLATAMSFAVMAALPAFAQAPATDPENTLFLDIKGGRVVIQLLPDLAPKHVARVKALTRKGFYDNTPFHRVIEGFMAQGGDPTGTGTGGSDLGNLPAEFTRQRGFVRGTVGAARTSDPNSANSQFFICLDDATFLDRQYTVWGVVSEGMDHVDALPKGEPPRSPGKIVKATVA